MTSSLLFALVVLCYLCYIFNKVVGTNGDMINNTCLASCVSITYAHLCSFLVFPSRSTRRIFQLLIRAYAHLGVCGGRNFALTQQTQTANWCSISNAQGQAVCDSTYTKLGYTGSPIPHPCIWKNGRCVTDTVTACPPSDPQRASCEPGCSISHQPLWQTCSWPGCGACAECGEYICTPVTHTTI